MICVIGLSISFLISFFILEYYYRKQASEGQPREKWDQEGDEGELKGKSGKKKKNQ